MYNYFMLVGHVRNIKVDVIDDSITFTYITMGVKKEFRDLDGELREDLIVVEARGYLGKLAEDLKPGDTIGLKGRISVEDGSNVLVADRIICFNKEESKNGN